MLFINKSTQMLSLKMIALELPIQTRHGKPAAHDKTAVVKETKYLLIPF